MAFVDKELLLDKTAKEDAEYVLDKITKCIRGFVDVRTRIQIPNVIAYVLWKISCYANPFSIKLADIMNGQTDIDPDVVTIIRDSGAINEDNWQELLYIAAHSYPRILALAVMGKINDSKWTGETTTKEPVVLLAKEILNCKDEDTVLDLCSGVGNFIYSVAADNPNGIYCGMEINPVNATLSRIRMELIGAKADIKTMNIFDVQNFSANLKYTKIFSNYPFLFNFKNIDGVSNNIYEEMAEKMPKLTRGACSDWAFNYVICEHLSEDGKAVAIMSNGAGINSMDIPVREYFAKAGLIESIISLPGGLVAPTGTLPCSMIVFSHGNNKVKMIDLAVSPYLTGKKRLRNSASVLEIVDAYRDACRNSVDVTVDALCENDYILSPSRYTKVNPVHKFEKAVNLGDMVEIIIRGSAISSKEVADLTSEEETDIKYLNLASIQDGLISDDLTNLVSLDKKQEKFCLKDKDIIIAKIGVPFKVAVASVVAGERILVGGNAHIIRVNQEKINPYYLAAFLESEDGQNLLEYNSVGSTMPVVGAEKLKSLSIPVPSMSEQDKIGEKYQSLLSDIKRLKEELANSIASRRKLFEA